MSWLRAAGAEHLGITERGRDAVGDTDFANGLDHVFAQQRGVARDSGIHHEIDFARLSERRERQLGGKIAGDEVRDAERRSAEADHLEMSHLQIVGGESLLQATNDIEQEVVQ